MTLTELAEFDAWIVKQMNKLKPGMEAHVMKGRSINDPDYRRNLGQHQAFSRMRSYIHGSRITAREQ